MIIAVLLLAIIVLVLLITKLKLHPFLALLLVSIATGLVMGMTTDALLSAIQTGFGDTLGKIGLVIILGVLIGSFLEHTGAAMVLAKAILSFVGQKRIITAMGVIGYMISIPVFCDSAFILLSTLNKTLSRKAGVSIAATSVALALGLLATHTLVPPTPGPVAAAGILGADLTKVMLLGLVVAAAATAAGIFFARKITVKTSIDIKETDVEENKSKPPSTFKSALPVLVPILLILLKSVSIYFDDVGWQSTLKSIFLFTGEPFIALLIGFACCLLLPEHIDKKMFAADGWTGKALESAASIFFITAAGGVFGKVLQQADAAGELGQALTATSLGLLLPFLLAAVLKTAQGSSTVAMITAASVLSPLMVSLGFISEWDKAMVVIAIGAGSMVISHVNDSFFWVVTQFSGMNVKTGHKLLSLGTLLIGVVAMLMLSIFYLLLH